MNKKHFACSLLALLPAFSVFAADFESDGIYYNITGSHTVSVVKGDYDYDGDVTIPAYVANGTHTYTVTAIAENAFQAMNIETVTLPEGLTSIGNQAFYQSSIKAISLPSTLSSMGISAFRECKNLTGVVLPDALKDIKEYAFYQCTGLKTLTLGNQTTTIEQQAFYSTAIEELELPSTMKTVGYQAFASCNQLKSLKINDAAVFLDGASFMDCKNLETLNLGNYATFGIYGPDYYQYGTFQNCTALTKVVIPSSATELQATFRGCTRLYDVTLPNTLTTIGARAFEGCAIQTLTIPTSVKTIGYRAFGNSAIEEADLSSVTTIMQESFYNCASLKNITLSSALKTIGSSAFFGCSISNLTIPSSVTSMGSNCFSSCKNLESVKIQNALATFESNAFSFCTNLKKVDLGNSIVSLGTYAFRDCTSLEKISLPSSLVEIGVYSFYGCNNLATITIPNSIQSIGGSAFQGCSRLEKINLPTVLVTIDGNAFSGCANLKELLIPESVNTVGQGAFQNCTQLGNVVFDNSPANIGIYAFMGCVNLTNLDLGEKIVSINNQAFDGCTKLESVVIPNSVQTLGYVFCNCTALKKATIGTGVKTINGHDYYKYGLFSGCTKLTSVEFKSQALTTIGICCFYNCRSLKKIELPSSVTSIGENSFNGCTTLSHIYMNATTPPAIQANTFPDYTTPTLHVPSSAKTAYTKADNWKLFTNVIAIGQEPKATAEEIAALETLLAQTQSLYNAAVEGTEPGNYRTGAKAALKAVINEVNARIAATMLTEDVEDCTELLNTATRSFKNKQIKNEYQTDNTLAFATSLKASRGAEFHLPIEMNNVNEISAVQFDLYLPEGMQLSTDEYGDYQIELGDRTTARRHSVSSRQMSDGALRVVVSSTQNATFTGNSGTLLTLLLFPQTTMEADDYDVELKNIVLTDPQATRYATADMKSVISVSAYTMGDVNNDAHIDVADLTGVVHFILEDADASLVFNAADMDGNGVVEVNDYAALVNVILDQGTASAAPIRQLTLLKKSQAGTGSAIALSDIELDDNGEGELLVQLTNNNESYTGMQFDLYLPEGMTLADDIETTSRQHGVWAKEQANGCYRVLCSSMTNAELRIGTVMRLAVKATNSIDNEAEVCASDIVLSDVNAQRHENANILSKVYESNETLGITTIGQDATQTTAIDLFGRRANAAKGDILVVDGKKIVR